MTRFCRPATGRSCLLPSLGTALALSACVASGDELETANGLPGDVIFLPVCQDQADQDSCELFTDSCEWAECPPNADCVFQCQDAAPCCDPAEEPETIEGSWCCADGSWQADLGNGSAEVCDWFGGEGDVCELEDSCPEGMVETFCGPPDSDETCCVPAL